MLFLEDYDENLNCREFTHDGDTQVFHKALCAVKRGECRFHVINHNGANFDLVYINNDYEMEHTEGFKRMFFFDHFSINGLLLEYDENKRERLIIDLFDGFDRVYFNRLNEYTIVLCKVLIRYTNKKVYFNDERIKWFFQDPKITVTKDFPKEPGDGYMIVCNSFMEQSIDVGLGRLYDIMLFNSVFFIDCVTDLDINQVKYVVFYIDKVEGIGALLINFVKAKKIFEKFGFKVYIKKKSSRFNDEMLHKYFKINDVPNDSDESNTIYIPNYFGAVLSCIFMGLEPRCDFNEIVKDEVIAHREEYRQAVLGNKKVMGVMIRGTDYLKNEIAGQQVSMEKIIALINKRMEIDGYDMIFLATEDSDRLKVLLDAFPGRVIALSQERYSVNDFKDGIKLISEIEKKNRSIEDQEIVTEDTTINYFYAIYLLSKCDGFLALPLTNGVRCVQMFNGDKFSYMEIL